MKWLLCEILSILIHMPIVQLKISENKGQEDMRNILVNSWKIYLIIKLTLHVFLISSFY